MANYRFPADALRVLGTRVIAENDNARTGEWTENCPQSRNIGNTVAPRGIVRGATGTRMCVGGDHVQREGRTVGFLCPPMMTTRNVQEAFTCYDSAMQLLMPRCNIPPYNALARAHIETIYVAACIATQGSFVGQPAPSDDLLYLYRIGNAFAIDVPATMCAPVEVANEGVLNGARAAAAALTNDERLWITHNFPAVTWNTVETAHTLPGTDVHILIECMAVHTSAATRSAMMTCYISTFLAYTQQGTVTVNKINKLTTALAGIGINVAVTPDRVLLIWTRFGNTFGEEAARYFFNQYEILFEGYPNMIVLRLLFQQAANAGLTGLTLIRDMITNYPTFPWDAMAGHYPNQWASFLEAHREVGDNVWFGFRKNLGIVGVRNYSAIVKCAITLRQVVMGDNNMAALRTVSNLSIIDVPFIDRLVADFAARLKNAENVGDREAALRYFDDGEAPAGFAIPPPAPAGAADPNDVLNAILARLGGLNINP